MIPSVATLVSLAFVTSGFSQDGPADAPVTHSVMPAMGQYILFSPLVVAPVGATGTIDAQDQQYLTDSAASFQTAFMLGDAFKLGEPLTLTILSGPETGHCRIVRASTATTLTTDGQVAALDLVGAMYELRKAPTVASLFDSNRHLMMQGSPAVATLILIPDDPNDSGTFGTGYTRVYFSSGGLVGFGWRGLGLGFRDMSQHPIAPWKGVLAYTRHWWPPGTPRTYEFTGHPPTRPSRVPVNTGFNPVSRGTIGPLTLQASRLHEDLHPGTPTTADIIWNPEGAGDYSRYYWSAGGLFGTGWRKIGAGSTDCAQVPLASAFFIKRNLGPTTVTLPPAPL